VKSRAEQTLRRITAKTEAKAVVVAVSEVSQLVRFQIHIYRDRSQLELELEL